VLPVHREIWNGLPNRQTHPAAQLAEVEKRLGKELTAFMVGEVLAPAVIVGAVFYHMKLPGPDLAISLATLWLVSVMVIEWITPKPISPYFMTAAVTPSILVGAWLHGLARWRRRASDASQGKGV